MKTVLCYGDSNTWGYVSDPTNVLPLRLAYNERWTGILQTQLINQFQVIEEGLNSRTTVIDDPLNDDRNGKKYLKLCIETHAPVDLVLLMLGTNDLKVRFNLSAGEIVYGIEILVQMIRAHSLTAQSFVPKIIVLSPPPLGETSDEDAPMFIGAKEKSIAIAKSLKISASNLGYKYLDTHSFLNTADLDNDGIHLSRGCQSKFAAKMAEAINDLKL